MDSGHAIAVTRAMGIEDLTKTFAPTIAGLETGARQRRN